MNLWKLTDGRLSWEGSTAKTIIEQKKMERVFVEARKLFVFVFLIVLSTFWSLGNSSMGLKKAKLRVMMT